MMLSHVEWRLMWLMMSILVHRASLSYVSYKKKATTVAPPFYIAFGALQVTDGNEDVCLQTLNSYDIARLEIDMEREYSVSMVTIINIASSIEDMYKALIGVQVEVSGQSGNGNCGPVITENMVNRSAIVDVICDPPLIGQFVRLQFGTGTAPIHICEVRVYSDEIEQSECTLEPDMQDYRGIVDVTTTGIICQKWSSQFPHIHLYLPDFNPELGDHNLCRNVGNYDTVWCFTVDVAVPWEECDIPVNDETCPRARFKGDLNPLNICYGVSHSLILEESHFVTGLEDVNTGQPIKINVPMNIKARIPNDGRFQICSVAFTIAFYIFPYSNSNGPILAFGNTDITRFLIVQMPLNDILYNSDVMVSYGMTDIVRTTVLWPEAWTFLAVTFSGQHRLLTVWRDGEIASIANTDFASIAMDFDELEFGSDANNFDGVVANIGWLQVYDRVLNEAEMKAARNKQIKKCDGLFQLTSTTDNSEDRSVHTSITASIVRCANKCRHNLSCLVFRHSPVSKLCAEFQSAIVDASIIGEIYEWKVTSQLP